MTQDGAQILLAPGVAVTAERQIVLFGVDVPVGGGDPQVVVVALDGRGLRDVLERAVSFVVVQPVPEDTAGAGAVGPLRETLAQQIAIFEQQALLDPEAVETT